MRRRHFSQPTQQSKRIDAWPNWCSTGRSDTTEVLRTGVELDDDRVADAFDPGPDGIDPALIWYIDLRCEGEGVPDDPEPVLDWLLEHGPIIRDGFSRLAEHLRNGYDPDIYTLKWTDFQERPQDVTMLIACSAIRRVDAREIGSPSSEHSRDELGRDPRTTQGRPGGRRNCVDAMPTQTLDTNILINHFNRHQAAGWQE